MVVFGAALKQNLVSSHHGLAHKRARIIDAVEERNACPGCRSGHRDLRCSLTNGGVIGGTELATVIGARVFKSHIGRDAVRAVSAKVVRAWRALAHDSVCAQGG